MNTKKGFFEIFSNSSKRILIYAREEVEKSQHKYLKPEHILLGILKLKDDASLRLLQEEHINPSILEATVIKSLPKGKKIYPIYYSIPKSIEEAISLGTSVPFTKNATMVISLAKEEFEKSKDKQLEPKHILLGILKLNYQPIKKIFLGVIKIKK